MNLPSGELALAAVVLCSIGGFTIGRAWGSGRAILWVISGALFLAGIFALYCAAFTE